MVALPPYMIFYWKLDLRTSCMWTKHQIRSSCQVPSPNSDRPNSHFSCQDQITIKRQPTVTCLPWILCKFGFMLKWRERKKMCDEKASMKHKYSCWWQWLMLQGLPCKVKKKDPSFNVTAGINSPRTDLMLNSLCLLKCGQWNFLSSCCTLLFPF